MSRVVDFEQGLIEIEQTIRDNKYNMYNKAVFATVRNILCSVRKNYGPMVANALITKLELTRPLNGCHQWFVDGTYYEDVIQIDPNFVTPRCWKIYPGDRRYPDEITMESLGL